MGTLWRHRLCRWIALNRRWFDLWRVFFTVRISMFSAILMLAVYPHINTLNGKWYWTEIYLLARMAQAHYTRRLWWWWWCCDAQCDGNMICKFIQIYCSILFMLFYWTWHDARLCCESAWWVCFHLNKMRCAQARW